MGSYRGQPNEVGEWGRKNACYKGKLLDWRRHNSQKSQPLDFGLLPE